ncbi:MAG: MaoC family dehydratase N-terminal domain-containing protein [Rhodovibrionaceae bacterium]
MGEASGVKAAKDVQTSQLNDEMIEKAREMIGVWLRRDVHFPTIAEPISLQDIRRWALYSVGDDNPLWMDGEHAKRSIWGSNIAPPTFLYSIDSGIVAPGLRGVQWIFAGGRWENFRPVRVGDALTSRARLIDVRIREGKRVARYVNQVGEVLYYNQRDELVARYEGDIFRVPRAKSGQGFRYSKQDGGDDAVKAYTDEEIEEIAEAYRTEERRGGEPRYWESVEVGDCLPVLYKGPLTLVDIVGFYAGRRSVYNVLKLAFAERERHPANVYYSPKMNYPVHPAAGHFDVEIAREVGMPGAYDQGWMRLNWAGHLLTNWGGDHAFVRKLSGRVTRPNLVGDLTKLTGKVVEKTKTEDEALVEIEWWGTNNRGATNCDGKAMLRLPSRDTSIRC